MRTHRNPVSFAPIFLWLNMSEVLQLNEFFGSKSVGGGGWHDRYPTTFIAGLARKLRFKVQYFVYGNKHNPHMSPESYTNAFEIEIASIEDMNALKTFLENSVEAGTEGGLVYNMLRGIYLAYLQSPALVCDIVAFVKAGSEIKLAEKLREKSNESN